MASDGSLLNHSCASHGWKLHSRVLSKAQASRHGFVSSSGGGLKMSSLRPEAGGFLAAMVAMDVLLVSTGPRSGEFMDRPEQTRVSPVYIDNKALTISRIKNWKHRGPSETLRPDYDLIQAVMNLSKKHRLDLQVYHVKSHQDDVMDYSDLPWEAKLNVDCVALAASV